MNAATLVTSLRIILAPVYFFIFIATPKGERMTAAALIALWLLYAIIEISDFIDGKIARKTGSVTDLGKVFDPFADSFARLTYFLAFLVSGIMPAWVFIVVLYRDLGVSFIRLMFMSKGIAMGAKLSGKLKAGVYAVAGAAVMVYVTLAALVSEGAPAWLGQSIAPLQVIVQVSWFACLAAAVWTMLDYAIAYRKHSSSH